MPQARHDHPLSTFGYSLPPFWLWRQSWLWLYCVIMALKDIWLIATGRLTLHKAWQAGYDAGRQSEWHRTVIMGGK